MQPNSSFWIVLEAPFKKKKKKKVTIIIVLPEAQHPGGHPNFRLFQAHAEVKDTDL